VCAVSDLLLAPLVLKAPDRAAGAVRGPAV